MRPYIIMELVYETQREELCTTDQCAS